MLKPSEKWNTSEDQTVLNKARSISETGIWYLYQLNSKANQKKKKTTTKTSHHEMGTNITSISALR